jgi:hypothetical protein
MEFLGTFRFDGHPKFDFKVSGRFSQSLRWSELHPLTTGELVLTVARVPFFSGSIEPGQSGRLQILGFEDLWITLLSVDHPRMDLRSRNLELAIAFESEEALKVRVADVILGRLQIREKLTKSLISPIRHLELQDGTRHYPTDRGQSTWMM